MYQCSPAIARWEELVVLLGITWDTREDCVWQGEWIAQLGWRVQVLDLNLRGQPPAAYDGALVYGIVMHPECDSSPGALRYRPVV